MYILVFNLYYTYADVHMRRT